MLTKLKYEISHSIKNYITQLISNNTNCSITCDEKNICDFISLLLEIKPRSIFILAARNFKQRLQRLINKEVVVLDFFKRKAEIYHKALKDCKSNVILFVQSNKTLNTKRVPASLNKQVRVRVEPGLSLATLD